MISISILVYPFSGSKLKGQGALIHYLGAYCTSLHWQLFLFYLLSIDGLRSCIFIVRVLYLPHNNYLLCKKMDYNDISQ